MDHPLVQVEAIIAAPLGAVWDTMVKKPSTLFMGAKVETDWKVGHPITMSGAFNGKPFKDGGEIRSFDPEHQLSFTNRSGTSKETNLVTFLLEPQGRGTRVRLSQTPLGGTKVDEDQKAKFEKTWSAMLDALKKEVVRQN